MCGQATSPRRHVLWYGYFFYLCPLLFTLPPQYISLFLLILMLSPHRFPRSWFWLDIYSFPSSRNTGCSAREPQLSWAELVSSIKLSWASFRARLGNEPNRAFFCSSLSRRAEPADMNLEIRCQFQNFSQLSVTFQDTSSLFPLKWATKAACLFPSPGRLDYLY
jgi:hypothetical protein